MPTFSDVYGAYYSGHRPAARYLPPDVLVEWLADVRTVVPAERPQFEALRARFATRSDASALAVYRALEALDARTLGVRR